MTTILDNTEIVCYNIYNDLSKEAINRDLYYIREVIMLPKYYYKISDVTEYTSLSRSSIDRKEFDGEFPKRVPLGSNRVGWIAFEVEQWCEEQVKKSRVNK